MRGNHLALVQPPETASQSTERGVLEIDRAGKTEPEVVLDDIYYISNYGITLKEAQQPVKYLDKEALLGEVLEHGSCPLGSWVKEAHQEGGREAVEQKLTLFGQMATEFTVVLDNDDYLQKKNLKQKCPNRTQNLVSFPKINRS